MKNLIKLLFAAAILFTSCRSVQKSTQQEKTFEKSIANLSHDSTGSTTMDSTASSLTTYDFEEKTTIEFPPGYNFRFSPFALPDSPDALPDSFPAGTKITTERKGKIQKKDTASKKVNADFSTKKNASNEVIKSIEKKASNKETDTFFNIPLVAVVLGILILIIALSLLNKFGFLPTIFRDKEEIS